MNYRRIGNLLAVAALTFFVVAIIGNAVGGSHRWVEPFEQAGWIFFVCSFLVLFLLANPDAVDPLWSRRAWVLGVIAILLFFIGIVINAVSAHEKSWYEALEVAGSLFTLFAILAAITARRERPGNNKQRQTRGTS
jgi:predicted tellurium resistance membrane protein TerC